MKPKSPSNGSSKSVGKVSKPKNPNGAKGYIRIGIPNYVNVRQQQSAAKLFINCVLIIVGFLLAACLTLKFLSVYHDCSVKLKIDGGFAPQSTICRYILPDPKPVQKCIVMYFIRNRENILGNTSRDISIEG